MDKDKLGLFLFAAIVCFIAGWYVGNMKETITNEQMMRNIDYIIDGNYRYPNTYINTVFKRYTVEGLFMEYKRYYPMSRQVLGTMMYDVCNRDLTNGNPFEVKFGNYTPEEALIKFNLTGG